ncbi:hypothetical protein AB0N05_15085 [Nocardia sp. NPDC051030]|uniref:hypothetical protein n=1 Tax=Nocardia sp. NPDC051030 TaxID=3155162 RepID=UPI00341B8D6A
MTGNDAGIVTGHSNDAVPEGAPVRHHNDTTADAPDTGDTDTSHLRRTTRQTTRRTADDIGGRLVARLGFGCGAILSVLANWLYTWLPADTKPAGWNPGTAPQIGSAVWPILLMLSVEVLLRVRWRPGIWWKLARYGGVGTVAIGSAIISYGHVYHVLMAWGYDLIGARVGPLAIDGFMVICGFAMLSESTPTESHTASHPIGKVNGYTVSRSTDSELDTPTKDPDIPDSARDGTDSAVVEDATPPDTTTEHDRDEHIRAMYRTVPSTREVGAAFGLHHSTVARIVAQSDTGDGPRDGLLLITGGAVDPTDRSDR